MASSHSDTASIEALQHTLTGPITGPTPNQPAQTMVTSLDADVDTDADADANTAKAAHVTVGGDDGLRQQRPRQDENQQQPQDQQQHRNNEDDDAAVLNEKLDASIAAPKTAILPRACTFSSTLTTVTNASSSVGLYAGASFCKAPGSGPSHRVTLVKAKKGDSYVPRDTKLENDLYFAIGFLELANAGDFAANVWNSYPVPVYATVLMVVGATFAGFMSIYAFLDSRRAWRNVQFLRKQYRELKEGHARRAAESQSTRDVDVLLSVVYRELGSEAINRWGLDIFMGIGAVLICVGTYLALGGANRSIFLASNLLSGYVGNAPIAFFGFVNTCWALYIFCKAQGHVKAAAKLVPGTRAMTLVRRRSRNVQIYSTINGTATILGGVGSLITATRWWGYVILIPVIFSSIFCNYWWRARAGYARRDLVLSGMPVIDPDELTIIMEFAAQAEMQIREGGKTPINAFVSDPKSLQCILAFMQEHELLEPFCTRLMKDVTLRAALSRPSSSGDLTISVQSLLALPEQLHPAMIQVAQDTVRKHGQKHFRYRQRYAAELLGTYFTVSQHQVQQKNEAGSQGEKPGSD